MTTPYVENGINVDTWTLTELQQVVEEFKASYQRAAETEDQPKDEVKEGNKEDEYEDIPEPRPEVERDTTLDNLMTFICR